MKTVLGLDIGTNSIGWALIRQEFGEKQGEILGMGSRVIPMSQDILGNFSKGVSISQTAERTAYRGVRRLRERHLLRRERLHRILHILGFLPQHYANKIDFKDKLGKFFPGTEPKLVYDEAREFIFRKSFLEMMEDFKIHQPQILINEKGEKKRIPYDWTIYYLRKKALTQKIEKEELAWILLHFNQKRGYYQLRGEEEEEHADKNKKIELHSLLVTEVVEEETNAKGQKVYKIVLENGWEFNKPSNYPVEWKGKTRDFIVTTEYEKDGSIKKDRYGKEKRTFRAPVEDDWNLVKKKTEAEIEGSGKTVGESIYGALLQNPEQKIKGDLIRTIERKYYKDELEQILIKQKEFHPELQNQELYKNCINELYKQNDAYKKSIASRDFTYLFLEDIIFYQRPLKSKKHLISNCRYEYRYYTKDGENQKEYLKVIAKSNPVFQEFRLWQWIHNARIYKREVKTDLDVTQEYLNSKSDYTDLFDFLNGRKEIDQKAFLKYFKLSDKEYRWNYVEDKKYPGNETRAQIRSHLAKIEDISRDFLTQEIEYSLWHVLYSINDKEELKKALKTFASKRGLKEESFFEAFRKFPLFDKEYGSYSEKAIKKILPLLRVGKYWSEQAIAKETRERIENIKERLQEIGHDPEKLETITDDDIPKQVLKSFIYCTDPTQGLNTYQACYAIYGRHSEEGEAVKWDYYSLEEFVNKFKQHSLRNPIVEQVVTETLRVVKDIWKTFGKEKENFFDEIHVELGREMKNPADKRKEITNRNLENENTNLRIKALLSELLHDKEITNVRPYSRGQQEILKIYEEYALGNEEKYDNQANKFIKDPPTEEILKISKTAQPTKSQLEKYKLWLEQRYRSPYTGQVIPLNELFTPRYEIEHIIPQSRYFDNSFSNKVICESEVNKEKGNATGYEFIDRRGGEMISMNTGGGIPLFTLAEYEKFVEKHYTGKNKAKKKKLLMEDIPEGMIERQLNDTRYISKYIKNLLSNIIRVENEQETTSKNLVSASGSITAVLRKDWGLDDVWNTLITPRFQRLNEITHSLHFGDINSNTGKFLPTVPLEYSKGFSKKRIDHRHHPLDALVIACLTKDHINYITSLNTERKNYALVSKLRKVVEFNGNKVAKEYLKPWSTFTQEVREELGKIIVSFKQNTRVINKTVNKYQVIENGEKVYKTQEKGDSWAIRKPLHKETVYGKVRVKREKNNLVSVSQALANWQMIKNPEIRKIVQEKISFYKDNEKGLKKYFKDHPLLLNGEKVEKVEMYEWIEATAGRVKLDNSLDRKKIEKITDTGIQKILIRHLDKEEYQNQQDDNGKKIPAHEVAFSEQGLEELNKNLKNHKPIYKVRIYEEGNRTALGHIGNKKDKYVEAAKGTNLFFAVYQNSENKRSYETISLNEVIENQKRGAIEGKKFRESSVSDTNKNGDHLVFHLSPNDLVYVPTEEERENTHLVDLSNLTKEQINRIYKTVSFSGSQCFFVKQEVATSIVNKMEFSSLNKMEKSIDDSMIKESCWKLEVNRLGIIQKITR